MRRLLFCVLPLAVLLAGCSSSGYDYLETASIKPKTRFKDTDPQNFGAKHPQQNPVHGIDISKWQGDIDWGTVKNSGVAFAFIKATEGKDRVDSRFDEYWREAGAAGIPHAPYHFYYFCSSADQQADWFIRNVPKQAMRLPPVLDVEWNAESKTCRYRPDAETVRAEMQRFMDRLEAYYGKRPIIYTSVDFHRENLAGHFQDYHFWVRSVAKHPEVTYSDRRWAFWQYTSTGVVPGIKGPTDINVFAGSSKNWNNWVAAVSKDRDS
ncbi:glycoside hydrolase (plasmid) [Rhizobium leguminosarum bv. viciae]|uniref:glycoside hydrolase family 25 protein n=1 Tax=Rhizobium leguminosarum TaxID=384 RepID=UPI00035CBB0A|nr:GH25 family lysozyme [Rhizobium leguminosarum]ASR11238.1 glycoside hydrolase [Rhizobium leguminosarum bv. viciae]MBY5751323.1 glycoside hydrolase family 25 protein [Rhizobium leguminosarum]MBY5826513.1 glycoside hydrolase family 25 protein [Rhizobium leguminosarum]NKN02060.1 glycoside hydrolase [Rhizobium leguminosarum bv. viciae]